MVAVEGIQHDCGVSQRTDLGIFKDKYFPVLRGNEGISNRYGWNTAHFKFICLQVIFSIGGIETQRIKVFPCGIEIGAFQRNVFGL